MRHTGAATLVERDALRLFLALPVPAVWLEALAAWQQRELAGRAGVRPVPAANLHVTLVFLGRTPASSVGAIAGVLREAAAGLRAPRLEPARYRETRSVAMLELGDEGGRALALQRALAERLQASGLHEPERRPWLAHLTVARLRGKPPALRPDAPVLAPASPSGVALYSSVLRSSGAQYDVLETIALGG